MGDPASDEAVGGDVGGVEDGVEVMEGGEGGGWVVGLVGSGPVGGSVGPGGVEEDEVECGWGEEGGDGGVEGGGGGWG